MGRERGCHWDAYEGEWLCFDRSRPIEEWVVYEGHAEATEAEMLALFAQEVSGE